MTFQILFSRKNMKNNMSFRLLNFANSMVIVNKNTFSIGIICFLLRVTPLETLNFWVNVGTANFSLLAATIGRTDGQKKNKKKQKQKQNKKKNIPLSKTQKNYTTNK